MKYRISYMRDNEKYGKEIECDDYYCKEDINGRIYYFTKRTSKDTTIASLVAIVHAKPGDFLRFTDNQ